MRRAPTGSGSAPGSDSGGLHAAQFRLEVLDLVAVPGRYLELQLGRSRVHLISGFLDQGDQITARASLPAIQ